LATTKQLVSWIRLNAQKWNRVGEQGILPILNEAQNILMQQEADQALKYDSVTGDVPVLNTVAGQFEYDMPADVWRVTAIMTLVPFHNDLTLPYSYEYGIETDTKRPYEEFYFNGKKYMRLLYCRTVDASYGVPCKVRFLLDPGTSQGAYQYRGYIRPRQLTSEAIPLSLPEKFHFTHLLPATMKMIEAIQFGDWAGASEWVRGRYAKEIQEEMGRGEQGESILSERRDI